jgi:hypothetical protein
MTPTALHIERAQIDRVASLRAVNKLVCSGEDWPIHDARDFPFSALETKTLVHACQAHRAPTAAGRCNN